MEGGNLEKNRLIEYSLQLSMVKLLLIKKAISQEEYEKIKLKIMRDYKVTSNI